MKEGVANDLSFFCCRANRQTVGSPDKINDWRGWKIVGGKLCLKDATLQWANLAKCHRIMGAPSFQEGCAAVGVKYNSTDENIISETLRCFCCVVSGGFSEFGNTMKKWIRQHNSIAAVLCLNLNYFELFFWRVRFCVLMAFSHAQHGARHMPGTSRAGRPRTLLRKWEPGCLVPKRISNIPKFCYCDPSGGWVHELMWLTALSFQLRNMCKHVWHATRCDTAPWVLLPRNKPK